jgi:glycerol-3-phosphate acyltransferase PlsX
MIIALDVMGGDNAPKSNILGVKRFLNSNPNVKVILVGHESIIQEQLKIHKFDDLSRIEIYHSPETIAMDEPKPSMIFKTKPNSSIVQSIKLVSDGLADAIISAGNTAALLSSSLFVLGKIKGIKRPTLATYFPSREGGFVLSDVGANMDVKPIHLLQFAAMASIYAKNMKKIDSVKVGLLNIGSEKNKGNALTQSSFKYLENNIKGFIGNIEPRYLFEKNIDVVVCDGFAGNVILKLTEGLISHLNKWMNSKDEIKNNPEVMNIVNSIFNNYNYEAHGASPFLGVKGIVLKCHGACSDKSIESALNLAHTFSSKDLLSKIENDLENDLSLTTNLD